MYLIKFLISFFFLDTVIKAGNAQTANSDEQMGLILFFCTSPCQLSLSLLPPFKQPVYMCALFMYEMSGDTHTEAACNLRCQCSPCIFFKTGSLTLQHISQANCLQTAKDSPCFVSNSSIGMMGLWVCYYI